MAMPENVINKLKTDNVVTMGKWEVYDQIERFLTNKTYRSGSEKTKTSYMLGIRRFFKVIKNKELEFLTIEDIQITIDELENFINIMAKQVDENDKTLNNKTINGNMTSVTELLKHFKNKKMVDDVEYLLYGAVPRLPEEDNEYGALTVYEVKDFADWALANEKELGDVKYHFIRLALDTCLRKDELLSLTWDSFEPQENGEVAIKVRTKGNKRYRGAIKSEYYNEILQLKDKYNSEKVFRISSSTMQNAIVRWKKVRNIPKARNIVIHSIRKGGATYQYRITGDILQAQMVLGHKNIDTTRKYLGVENYGAIGAISSEVGLDHDLYSKVSHEELIAIIAESKSIKTLINIKLNEKLNNKK